MPNVNITELDLTSPGALNAESNIVYVPGIAKYLPEDFETMKPRLYTSLAQFQKDFGDKVPRIGLGSLAGSLPGFDTDFAYDTGFIYATELLRAGIPVLYDCLMDKSSNKSDEAGATSTNYAPIYNPDPYMYNNIIAKLKIHLNNALLRDKGLYNIKFVSNGGYVLNADGSGTNNDLLYSLSTARKDCCAVLDFKYNTKYAEIHSNLRSLANIGMISGDSTTTKYCAAFFPWGIYNPPCIQNYVKETSNSGQSIYNPSTYELPASFGYLMAAAKSFSNGVNNWAAIAGAARGDVPFLLSLKEELTEEQANLLQERDNIAINPILTINPFGKIIWGNRTLHDNAAKGNLTASSFLNIRNLISDIKKTIFTACRQMTFEQNSAILWIKFKSLITPTLDKMVSGAGLSGYELIKVVNKEKAKLTARVRLYAIEAVEDFDITIELADDTTSVTE